MTWRRVAATCVVAAALAAPAMARWPEGCLNYCGFDTYWDEAGWRDGGWMQGGTPGMSFDTETKRYGRSSLRVEGAAGETRYALQLGGFAIDRTASYVFRAWVKTEAIEDEAALAVQVHSAPEPGPFLDLGQGSRLQGTHDWTLLEVKLADFPPEAVRMYPYLWAKGPGTAWFDEVSLSLQGVEVPLGGERPITEADYGGVRFDDTDLPANLIPNAGFEQGLQDWYVESGQPVVDDTTAAEGERSVRFDGSPEGSYSAGQVGNASYSLVARVRVDPHRAYRLSGRLKTALQAGLSCVQLIAFRADGSGFGWWFSQDHTWEFLYGRGTQDWHEEQLVLREFPPETDTVNVYLLLQDALGAVWFDDVRLTPLSLAETEEVRRR